MARNLYLTGVAGLGASALVWLTGCYPGAAEGGKPVEATPQQPVAVAQLPRVVGDIGNAVVLAPGDVARPLPPAAERPKHAILDPVVVSNCRLLPSDDPTVPSQRDSMVLVLGTEVPESTPASRDVVGVEIGGVLKKFRRLRIGDPIHKDQLLGYLDPRLAQHEVNIREAKHRASLKEADAARKTTQELIVRAETQRKLLQSSATSREEYRGAEVQVDRARAEEAAKVEAIEVTKAEMAQAKTQLEMYEIRAAISGVVKHIHKQKGEAVKDKEPLIQLISNDMLWVEGSVPVQYVESLTLGQEVVLEMPLQRAPLKALNEHRLEVTGVAFTSARNQSRVVSASEDGTARVWDPRRSNALRVYEHGTPVKAVAATPHTAAEGNLIVTGAGDGTARIFDLARDTNAPAFELKGQHRKAINCVAFRPDGRWCATGGEDNEINLWDTTTGQHLYRVMAGQPGSVGQPAHRAAVTSLQFRASGGQVQLISAAKDKTALLWSLGDKGARLEKTLVEKRSGEVATLGLSADGNQMLCDHGRELRILSLADGGYKGALRNYSSASPFSTMALFSPDGRLALSANASEARVQLWRLPTDATRGYELVNLMAEDRPKATCGAFAPDAPYLATGGDRQVYVWAVPTAQEVAQQIKARLVYIDPGVEANATQRRIRAELDNSTWKLPVGGTATLVVYPK